MTTLHEGWEDRSDCLAEMMCDAVADGDGIARYNGSAHSASSTSSSGSVLSSRSEHTDMASSPSTEDANICMDELGRDKQALDPCNLIVNYLPYNVSDNLLTKIFSECGQLFSAKVCKDKLTKHSLGYGFVRYVDPACACNAIAKLNGFKLNGKVLKVSVARPPSEDIKNCKLYITNLPKTMSTGDVAGLFKEYGEIIECRLLQDTSPRNNGVVASRGVAFVQYSLKQEAKEALTAMNGKKLAGSDKSLLVKYADDQGKSHMRGAVHSELPRAGRPAGAYYPVDRDVVGAPGMWFAPQGGVPGAYMYGHLPDASSVPYSLEPGRQGRYVDFYPLSVPVPPGAAEGGAQAARAKLLVSNLPSFWNSQMLSEMFAQFGLVLACKVAMQGGQCSGEGYVKMSSGADAQFAARSIDGAMLGYGCAPLVVRLVWQA